MTEVLRRDQSPDDGVPMPAPPSNSAVDRAYRRLKSAILSNQLQARHPISDQRFAEELGISRTPVREALQRLQHEGYVAISPRRGVHVVPISLDEMHRTYEMITALEVHAVRLATLRGPPDEALQAMREAVAGMRTHVHRDIDLWSQADLQFHTALLTACGNTLIRSQGLHCWERVSRAHRVALRLRSPPVLSTEAHAEVSEMIARRDTENAVKRHLMQRERSGRELIEAMARVGLTEL